MEIFSLVIPSYIAEISNVPWSPVWIPWASVCSLSHILEVKLDAM